MSVFVLAEASLVSEPPSTLSRFWAITGTLLALLSWTLAEIVMAPTLRSWGVLLFAMTAFLFFALTVWYFRMGKWFGSGWQTYSDGLPFFVTVTSPMHLMLPVALIAQGTGAIGFGIYELTKLGVVLALFGRLATVLQKLSGWPAWAGGLLAMSPFVLGMVSIFFFAAVVMLTLPFVLLGGFR